MFWFTHVVQKQFRVETRFTVTIDKDANKRAPTNGLDVFFTRNESEPLVFSSQLFRHKRDRSMDSMLKQSDPIIPCPFHRLTLVPPTFIRNEFRVNPSTPSI
jgi:hypothetical protein